jgi:hypothetical protein
LLTSTAVIAPTADLADTAAAGEQHHQRCE